MATSDAAPDSTSCDQALAHAFDFLGKRWNGVILGTLGGGAFGFSQLARALDGISDSVLSDRLSELTNAGLVARVVNDGPPVSVSYTLTECGGALLPSLASIAQWASTNLPKPAPSSRS